MHKVTIKTTKPLFCFIAKSRFSELFVFAQHISLMLVSLLVLCYKNMLLSL